MIWAVLCPRRSVELSTTSSCKSVAVWISSITAAKSMCFCSVLASARALNNKTSGRTRLPPQVKTYSRICLISGMLDSSCAIMNRSIDSRSSFTRLRIDSNGMRISQLFYCNVNPIDPTDLLSSKLRINLARFAPSDSFSRWSVMPSFDIVSNIDNHEITNAIDQTNREVSNRFDFKDTNARVELNKDKITHHCPE